LGRNLAGKGTWAVPTAGGLEANWGTVRKECSLTRGFYSLSLRSVSRLYTTLKRQGSDRLHSYTVWTVRLSDSWECAGLLALGSLRGSLSWRQGAAHKIGSAIVKSQIRIYWTMGQCLEPTVDSNVFRPGLLTSAVSSGDSSRKCALKARGTGQGSHGVITPFFAVTARVIPACVVWAPLANNLIQAKVCFELALCILYLIRPNLFSFRADQ